MSKILIVEDDREIAMLVWRGAQYESERHAKCN